ncbi:MAG: ribonuclease [Rhodocyclales bacterium]|nr:ribonuclease [Rhodocyclales bacterium]
MHTADITADTWIIHCDGTALPNPGRIGIGAVLVAPDGVRHTLSQATDAYGCNNEAEARALIAALHAARALGASSLHIRCDSSILVEQLGAVAVAPIARLAHVFAEARLLLSYFAQIELRWVPHRRNLEADALARGALGLVARPQAKQRAKKRR